MKTYVITLSRAFMKGHPEQGKPTGFEDAVKTGRKIHTIRCNLPLWEKRIREVADGEARISIRQWTGKPYRSKQREIMQLTAEHEVGIQRIVMSRSQWEESNQKHSCYWATIENKEVEIEDLSRNDGFFDCADFLAWFDPALDREHPDKDGWKHCELAIIHFSPFRYSRKNG